MTKNFLVRNKLIGVTLFFLYFINLIFDIKILHPFLPSRVNCADSWWYWPIKYIYDTSKYVYDSSKYIYDIPTYLYHLAKFLYDSPTYLYYLAKFFYDSPKHLYNTPKYLYDFTKYLFYPPPPAIVEPPFDPNAFIIPYVIENEVMVPPTELELAQAFIDRLTNDGTWVYFLLFIVYTLSNFYLFWGLYSFFKTNLIALFSLKFFDVLQEKVKEVYFIYIIWWCLLQIYLFEIDVWDANYTEWYYATTAVLFFYFLDYVLGNWNFHSPEGFYYKTGNKEKAFWFFKGHHLEFFSMYTAFCFGATLCLDYFDLLPKT